MEELVHTEAVTLVYLFCRYADDEPLFACRTRAEAERAAELLNQLEGRDPKNFSNGEAVYGTGNSLLLVDPAYLPDQFKTILETAHGVISTQDEVAGREVER